MNQYRAPFGHTSVLTIILYAIHSIAAADVSTDGSLGAVTNFTGPDFVIPESAGAVTGSNLFHSFSEFDINSAQSATFTGNASINNVIGRITGGVSSTIDGMVTNAIAGSNLYLVNPYGIVFGGNAVINVDGSFYASSADYLVLGDAAGRFDARNTGNSVLSTAPPSAFGFLATTPAAVEVYGTQFNLTGNATLGLTGGAITVSGAPDPVFNPAGTVDYRTILNNGSYHIAAINQAAEYAIATAAVTGGGQLGDVIFDQAWLSVLGDDPGTVYIRAGRLMMSDSSVDVVNQGGANNVFTAIDIIADERFDIRHNGTANARALASETTDSGRGGDIHISTGILDMQGNIDAAGSGGGRILIHSVTRQSGQSGDININAGEIRLSDNSSIQAETVGTGDAGDINIDTGLLELSSTSNAPAFISANAFDSIGGGGGDINIRADNIELLRGNTGFVGITAQGRAATSSDRADGGSIQIDTGTLSLTGGAQVTTSVFRGTGQAGDIAIRADSIEVSGFSPDGFLSTIGSTSEGSANTSGSAGTVSIDAGDIHLRDYGRVTTFADTFGNAGNIFITADSIGVERGALISSVNIGAGVAGDIGINADNILLSGNHADGFRTGIFALSGALGAGAGDIDIDATMLEILSGAQINSDTNGAGNGGVININADELTVTGGNSITGEASRISSRTLPFLNFVDFATGNAGTINIHSDTISVTGGGLITSESNSAGKGGNINITAGQLILQNNGGISAGATATGDAGQISIDANEITANAGLIATSALLSAGGDMTIRADTLELNNGTVVSSTTAGDFNGGDIVVDAGRVRINGGSRVAASSTGSGDSGNIRLNANFIVINDSTLEATSSQSGLAGDIELTATESIDLVNSRIFTEAGLSDGGNISMAAVQRVYLKGSIISSSVSDGLGDGGNISIDPVFVILDGSSINANAHGGNGGNIEIRADYFIASPDSTLTASSSLGLDGNIVIDTPGNNLTDALDKLPQQPVDTSLLAGSDCGAVGKGRSTFTVRRRAFNSTDYLAPISSLYSTDKNAADIELSLEDNNAKQSFQCSRAAS